MPGPDGSISIALDFDGSLVEANVTPLRWRPHAKEFVLGAAAAGIKQWLYSCRCAVACNLVEASPWEPDEFWRTGNVSTEIQTSWALFEEMRAFLEAEGVWMLMTPWTLPGKPFADIIADDKAEAPDWSRLAAELGVHLAPAFPGGVSSPHAQQGRPATDVRGGSAGAASAPDPFAVTVPGATAATAEPSPGA